MPNDLIRRRPRTGRTVEAFDQAVVDNLHYLGGASFARSSRTLSSTSRELWKA